MSDAWNGVPENPERDGWHWLQDSGQGPEPRYWLQGAWMDEPGDRVRPGIHRYLGPMLTPAEITAREAASAEAMREACAADADCGCAARDDVLARYATHGHKRASYLCGFGDSCCALQAIAIRALPLPHASALARALAAAEKRGMEKIAEKMATEIEEYLGEGHFVARFIRNAAAQEAADGE